MALKLILKCSKALSDRKLTIAFAESATSGRLCAEFSLTPESGNVLKGGIVCYNASVKEEILKVPVPLILKHTPESPEVTEKMAIGLKKLMKSDIHIAITGLTTSGGSETPEKPVGTMFIHFLMDNKSIALRMQFKGRANEIIRKTVNSVAQLILGELKIKSL